jgi:hypothetical protein
MVIDIYVAMADGAWVYEPKAHRLLPHSKDDIRAQTGLQDFVANAPLNLDQQLVTFAQTVGYPRA